MPKINQEEYEILKELDDKWKWITRDEDSKKSTFPNELWLYEYKPQRSRIHWLGEGGATKRFGNDNLFQFIKHKDSEPYNIAELIEEYKRESHIKQVLEFYEEGFRNVREAFIKLSKAFSEESEETEVKNIEWLKKEIGELPCVDTVFNSGGSSYIDSAVPVMAVYDLLDQLDEPEANSQIDKLAYFIMSEVEGEPSQNQGAVDTAIRIIKSYQNQETLSQDISKKAWESKEFFERLSNNYYKELEK